MINMLEFVRFSQVIIGKRNGPLCKNRVSRQQQKNAHIRRKKEMIERVRTRSKKSLYTYA